MAAPDPKSKTPNPHLSNVGFQDPLEVFAFRPKTLCDIKSTARVVLDTNTLLVPYDTSSSSLSEIRRVYGKLRDESRLVVPAQVAREFARHRATKLANLFSSLKKRQNGVNYLKGDEYPLLRELPSYDEALKAEKELENAAKRYRKAYGNLAEHISDFSWNDPVSILYGDLFSAATIRTPADTEEQLLEALRERFERRIPPGFQDRKKADEGIGDFLIWKTILETGKIEESDIIFVSNDEKNDWWHRSENQALYPLYELVDEFRSFTGGKTFHIVRLSELLRLFEADETVVEEIRQEEASSIVSSTSRQSAGFGAVELVKWALERLVAVDPSTLWFDLEGWQDNRRIGIDVYDTQSVPQTSLLRARIEKAGLEAAIGRLDEAWVLLLLGHYEILNLKLPVIPASLPRPVRLKIFTRQDDDLHLVREAIYGHAEDS